MTKTQLYGQLVDITVKGAARGDGLNLTRTEAKIVLDEMIASDDAPEWQCCRQPGRDKMRQVVAIYRAM